MAKLSLNASTRVDVDPDMNDALWLRSLAQRLIKREHVNPPWPDGSESLESLRVEDHFADKTALVFDTQAAETAPVRILYTLADIDEL